MSRRSSLSALAVLAASGALIAGCSSAGSSSSSPPPAPATSAPVSSPTAVTPATSTAAGSSTKPSAADCTIIGKISSGVIATLEPLATESTSKAAASLKTYLAQLKTQQAQLTSPGGKAAVASFVAALQKASNETAAQATPGLTTAIGNLSSACA
jgi:hypothetical protein